MKKTLTTIIKQLFVTCGMVMTISYFVQTFGKCTMDCDFDCQRRFTVHRGK